MEDKGKELSEIVIEFGDVLGRMLLRGGYRSIADIMQASDEELLAVEGVGAGRLKAIREKVVTVAEREAEIEPEPDVTEEAEVEAEPEIGREPDVTEEAEELPEPEAEVEPEIEIEVEIEVEAEIEVEVEPDVTEEAEVEPEPEAEEAEAELPELADLEVGPTEPEEVEEELPELADLEVGPVEPAPFVHPVDEPPLSVRAQRAKDSIKS